MLDTILLVIAGLSQLALGILGVRLSTRRISKSHKIRYEWIFVVVGVIGFSAITGSGIRSGEVQTTIADGVRSIQNKLELSSSGRKPIIQKLGSFYAEGEKLANDGPPSRDPEEYRKYQAELKDWRLRTVQWLNENMGPNAAQKFLDWQTQFRPIGFEGAAVQEVWDRDYALAIGRNLDLMIQSDAWDKPIEVAQLVATSLNYGLMRTSNTIDRYGNQHPAEAIEANRVVIASYPVPIQDWIRQHGGLTRRLILLHGRALAALYPVCRWSTSPAKDKRVQTDCSLSGELLAGEVQREP
jgi:hypothetical protein